MLYFAYGANTNIDSMAMRCPKSVKISAIELPHWRLVFKSVADIEVSPNKKVHGVLWKITDECEKSLDYFEGYPHLYRKEYFNVSIDGDIETVMFYKMNRKEYNEPSKYYFELIEEGYIQNQIPTDLLWGALRELA